jgi:hypothetical protein
MNWITNPDGSRSLAEPFAKATVTPTKRGFVWQAKVSRFSLNNPRPNQSLDNTIAECETTITNHRRIKE